MVAVHVHLVRTAAGVSIRGALRIAALASAVAGCANLPARVDVFPSRPVGPDAAAMAALLTGTLVVRGGCLRVEAPGLGYVVVWPRGYATDVVAGQLVVVDGAGTVVGAVGRDIDLGGGEVDYALIADRDPETLPAGCGAGPVWAAAVGG